MFAWRAGLRSFCASSSGSWTWYGSRELRGRMKMETEMGRRRKEARERDVMQYYKAVTARYDGIGGRRVVLDYELFVTAYTCPIDLFYFGSKMAVGVLRG